MKLCCELQWRHDNRYYKNSLSENFLPKMQNLDLKSPILGKYGVKIEIKSTHNSLRGKFQLAVGKLQLSVPYYSW